MNYFSFFFSPKEHLSPSRRGSEAAQSQTSNHPSTGFSSSSLPSRKSARYPHEQEIAGRFIDERKLQQLLNDEFGNDYQLQVCLCHVD